MSTTKQYILRIFIFIAIFLYIFVIVQKLVTPYWGFNPNEASGESDRYINFYNQPDDSLDYLVLGVSHSYTSVNPVQIYADTGLIGYNLGNAMQAIDLSYYWLVEACKSQSPRFVMLDVGSLLYPANHSGNANISKSLINMRPSLNKLEAAVYCKSNTQNILELLLPLYQFHTRWNSLSFEDLEKFPQDTFLNGAYLTFSQRYDTQKTQINDEQILFYNLTDTATTDTQNLPIISSYNQQYFVKILNFCHDNGINLIPVKFPTLNWSDEKTSVVKDFLNTYNLDLLVITDLPEWEDFWENDTWDNGYHTNYYGATKTSSCLSSYLIDLFDLTEKPNSNNYLSSNWDDYSDWEMEHLISSEMRISHFFERLYKHKENLIIAFSVKNDICKLWNTQMQYYIDRLGLKSDFYSNYQNSYISVIDAGVATFEEWASSPLQLSLTANTFYGVSIPMKIFSGGFLYNSSSSINIGGHEYSLGNNGLNCVVVNKNDGKVLYSASIGYSGSTWTFTENTYSNLWDTDFSENILLEDNEYMISPASDTDYALTFAETLSGSSLILQRKSAMHRQAFTIHHIQGNIYTIQPSGTNTYLSIKNGQTAPGANITFCPYALAPQEWYIEENPNHSYSIYSLYNKQALDIPQGIMEPGALLWTWSRNNASPQQFIFSPNN